MRKLFAGFGWDSSNVTDDDLSLFLKAKLQGQYNYIDHQQAKTRSERSKISIKRIEQHPQFSPDWLAQRSYIPETDNDRYLSIDDIKVGTI